VKSMIISKDVLNSRRVSSSKQPLKPGGNFFLLIEGERVGPFVQTGGKDHLAQILLDRGIVFEMDKPRSRYGLTS